MTDLTEKRLTDLELKLMEQEQTVQELSDMVSSQWQTIERLQLKLTSAHDRLVSLEESMPESSGSEKPPHY